MSDFAIRVENLSKRYPSNNLRTRRIGRKEETHDTMVAHLEPEVVPVDEVLAARRCGGDVEGVGP